MTYSHGESGYILWKVSQKQTVQGITGDKVCKYGLIRMIIGSGDGFQNLFHHSGVDFLVLPRCVTWELILDGYS